MHNSHRTSNASAKQTEAQRAKQRLTRAGCTACCASWDRHEIRPHGAVQTTLGGLLRNSGEHTSTSREQIPELFTWQGQKCTAILDTAIRWPTSLHTTVVDVTARCPHASRYGSGVPASPTKAAEDEKHKRHGSRVTPHRFRDLETTWP